MPNNSETQKRWACVKEAVVEKVIMWDGVQEWAPSTNYVMVELGEGSPVGRGWDYVDGEFVDNRPQLEEEE